MKQKLLLFGLLCCTLAWNAAKATETEPNDTRNQANTLALNGSNSGVISTATDVDWYKVTTNGDGRIDLTLTVSNSTYCYFALYDNDGVTLLQQTYTSNTATYSQDGLAAGTYYVKVFPYNVGQNPAYTIADALVKPAQANDAEPDSTKATALTLPLNGSTTGHINYYYNNHKDSVDEYKITTTADGALNLHLVIANSNYTYFALYDHDGTTVLYQNYTSNDFNYTVDGLAAGTYYVKIFPYNSSSFASYTLFNTLTLPAEPNDAEPDSTRATALTLPLNGSKKGHIGYYYNNHRDSLDEYKVTTNADGALNLHLVIPNSTYVYFALYDNDGTTVLYQNYTSNDYNYTVDGLAKGTYYVKIFPYNQNQFAPYTISNTLTVPLQANDAEPDSTKQTALTLPFGGSVTGHIGYFYDNHRDSVDEYKVTTNADGALNLRLIIPNSTYVYFALYDNDGSTVLYQNYTSNDYNNTIDGLAKGTYYVKIFPYNQGQFAPYTLKDTLYTYNQNDIEPNKYANQAMTLPANDTSTGHIGFYYNHVIDTTDWFKINYTGKGDLSVNFLLDAHVTSGASYAYMQIYKDTAGSPIYNNYTSTSETANFTGLTEGYYYVKIFAYNTGQFDAYSITPTFTQTDKAKIAVLSADSTANCDSSGLIVFKCRKSHAPYTVQLYNGTGKYGNAITVGSSGKAEFDNLPAGSYYAVVYGDGATGTAHSKSDVVTINLPKPTALTATAIKNTQAKLNYTAVSCADGDSVHYRVHGTTTWNYVKVANTGTYTLKGLIPSTTYDWGVEAIAGTGTSLLISGYAEGNAFTTTAAFAGLDDRQLAPLSGTVSVYPNPATTQIHITLNNTQSDKSLIVLKDMNGKAVWSTQSSGNTMISADVSKLPNGIYLLQIINADKTITTQKVVVTK